MRLRLDLAYDGTSFSGWAAQPGRRTVQGELEAGLARICRQDPATLRVTVAGRTDAGVHASGQVVHVDLEDAVWAGMPGRSDRAPELAILDRLAGVLPADILVRRAGAVPAAFDARFSALARTYRYRIADTLAARSPLRRDVVAHRRPLDVGAMHEAAQELLGEHDFLSFCKPREGASTIRTLRHVQWERIPDGTGLADAGLVVATVEADAFCHHMVRSIVGASVAVGEGRTDAAWMAALVATPRRDAAGAAPMFAPHGLTLEHVAYPDGEAALAAQSEASRVMRGAAPEPNGAASEPGAEAPEPGEQAPGTRPA